MTSTTLTSPRARVCEPAPYRFDGRPGAREFSADLYDFARGNGDAGERLNRFMSVAFADTATENIPGLMPTPAAAYVGATPYANPIWQVIAKPAPFTNSASFVLPNFSSDSNLTGDHTESTEPVGGTLVTAGETITPGAISGRLDVSREVLDAGRTNPATSQALWQEMTRSYSESLEDKAAAVLEALVSPVTITLTTAAVDDVLVAELRGELAALAHDRGGNALHHGFLAPDLHIALMAAADSSGRPLLTEAPTDGGQADGVMVAGRPMRASWALTGTSSWLVDPSGVHGWATPPTRLEIDTKRVSSIVVGIWGYAAVAVRPSTRVRKIEYAAS